MKLAVISTFEFLNKDSFRAMNYSLTPLSLPLVFEEKETKGILLMKEPL